MYKTFTITITMPMSWYSQNINAIKSWISNCKDILKKGSSEGMITVDIQETPDPTELETPSNVTDITPFIDYNDKDE